MATLRDVAAQAGVAISTVSRVLNARPDASVSAPVRKRIHQVAKDLGYRPNHYARGLVRGHGSQVALVFWSAAYQVASRRLRAIEHALTPLDHPVVSTDAASLPHGAQPLLDLLTPQLPEAVVFVGVTIPTEPIAEVVEELRERDVQCVIADTAQYVVTDLPCDVIRADRHQGMTLAMEHLLNLGHREIGLIHWHTEPERYAPYEDALQEAGISSRYTAFTDIASDDEAYYALGTQAAERTRELLEENPQITALCCRNDLLALGAMQGLQSLGLRVPEDLSIIGFDNDPWTSLLPVPLTTMAAPLAEMADAVAEALGSRLDGDDGSWRHEIFHYELRPRASTGPLRRHRPSASTTAQAKITRE